LARGERQTGSIRFSWATTVRGHAEQSADGAYDQLTACLGGASYDVYLNDVADWRCVPARVWKYTIGGYQVMKKWLSYRERALLGRDLKSAPLGSSPADAS